MAAFLSDEIQNRLLDWFFGKNKPRENKVKYYTHPLFGELLGFWQINDTEIETEWTNAPFVSFIALAPGIYNEDIFKSYAKNLTTGYLNYGFGGVDIHIKEIELSDGRLYSLNLHALQTIPDSVWTPIAIGLGK